MPTYDQRVVNERDDLDGMIESLELFLHGDEVLSLPDEDQQLLELQLSVMSTYLLVLDARIKRFESKYGSNSLQG